MIAVSICAGEHTRIAAHRTPYVRRTYVCHSFQFHLLLALHSCVTHSLDSKQSTDTCTRTHTHIETCARRLCILHIPFMFAARLSSEYRSTSFFFNSASLQFFFFFFFLFLAQFFFRLHFYRWEGRSFAPHVFRT